MKIRIYIKIIWEILWPIYFAFSLERPMAYILIIKCFLDIYFDIFNIPSL